jgi:release factor glutamine methyltransferase
VNLVDYLARASEYLERHDVASPRLNAELLMCDLLGITRIEIYTGFDRQLSESESDSYRGLVMKRAGGCPLQHITGETGFRGLKLAVRPGVFVPRPETEVLVEKALEVMLENASVLDVGCGCGNIALSIAAESEGARVTAIDIEVAAVELTRANATGTGLSERVEVLEGDLFAPLGGDTFDVIISNPPYVPEGVREQLPMEVRDFDPPAALFAGPEGLDVIRRLMAEAADHLRAEGWLLIEVDESHAAQVGRELESAGWAQVEVFDDLTGRPRVVRARRCAG